MVLVTCCFVTCCFVTCCFVTCCFHGSAVDQLSGSGKVEFALVPSPPCRNSDHEVSTVSMMSPPSSSLAAAVSRRPRAQGKHTPVNEENEGDVLTWPAPTGLKVKIAKTESQHSTAGLRW